MIVVDRLAVLMLLAMAGCGAAPERSRPSGPEEMSEAQLGRETERCRALGLKFYEDAACQAAQTERTRRFYAKPGAKRP